MSPKRPILQYIVAYLLWLFSVVLGYIILNLVRETLLLAIVVRSSAGNPTATEQFYQSYRVAATSHWSFFIMGILMIIFLVGLEHYYRNSVPTGKLWRRFFLVMWVEGLVLLFTHIVFILLRMSFTPFGWLTVAIPVLEAVVTAVFLWLWLNSRKTPRAIGT